MVRLKRSIAAAMRAKQMASILLHFGAGGISAGFGQVAFQRATHRVVDKD
jgi:hypothetical protein